MADVDIRLQEGTATARLNGIATPVVDTDAANRAYVDANVGSHSEILVEFTLSTSDVSFTGGGSYSATTGVISHTGITANARLYINGVLLQETTDYTLDDVANTITLVSRIRDAITATNGWCATIVDNTGIGSGGGGTTITSSSPQFGLGDIIRTAAPATVATMTGLTATTAGTFEFASETDLNNFLQQLAVHIPEAGQPEETTQPVAIRVGTEFIGAIRAGTQLVITRPLRVSFIGITFVRAIVTGDSVSFVTPNGANTFVRAISSLTEAQRSVSGTTISVTINSTDTDRFAAASVITLLQPANTQVILVNSEFGNGVYNVSNYVISSTQTTFDLNQVIALDFAGRTPAAFVIPTGDMEAYYCSVEQVNNRFEQLLDTPDSYTGTRGQQLRVNSTETGLEFFPTEFAVDVVRISGTVAGVGLNAANIIDGDYLLQANTNKYLSGAGDTVVTLTDTIGPYFWYNELRNVSLVAVDVTGLNENWRIVAGHWINDAVYAENYVVLSPNLGTQASAGSFVVVQGGGLLFPSTIEDLQTPAGSLLTTVVGGTTPAATLISGFDPARIDTHFLNRPLIEVENNFTVRTDLIGTPRNFVFNDSGLLTLPVAPSTSSAALTAATVGLVNEIVPGNVVERVTPTGAITFTQADIDGLDATINTLSSNVTVNNVVVASATVTATPGPSIGVFNLTATLDTLVAGWSFTSATLGPDDQPFTLVLGQTHEWTASFTSADVDGDLVINVADLSTETGVFYVAANSDEFRVDNLPVTTGSIEDLGFQTETDAADTFQAQSPDDPYVVTSDLSAYATTAALGTAVPITITRGTTFPTAPVNGDEHYLTTNIWPTGTTFVSETETSDASGTTVQTLTEHRVLDPEIQQMIVAGTTEVTLTNRPNVAERDLILPGGTGTTFYRGFVRDRSYNGLHVTRAQVVGTTTHTTTVSEVRYSLTDVSIDGGTTRSQLNGAFVHDYTYRLQTTSAVGARIVREVHYFVMQFANGGAIGTLLTEANAITTMEGLIQDSSSLAFALTSGSATPTEFPSTSAFTSTTVRATFASGFFTDYRYRFIPMNGFTIDTTTTRTNIGGAAVTLEADGSVNDFRPASNIMAWNVRFRRTFTNVPSPSGVTPLFTNGPHVFQTTWQRLDYVGEDVTSVATSGFFTNRMEFTASGNWSLPSGVTRFRVTLVPGGVVNVNATSFVTVYDVVNQTTPGRFFSVRVGAANTSTSSTAIGGQSSFFDPDITGRTFNDTLTGRSSTSTTGALSFSVIGSFANAILVNKTEFDRSGGSATITPLYDNAGNARGSLSNSSSNITAGIVVVEW